KIGSDGAGCGGLHPSNQPSFVDVPYGQPFWLYIERVYANGVISGYTGDGVTVNPCTGLVEQIGFLYFRPCANSTRGQTAKIVANTFYPGCQTPARRPDADNR